MIKSQFLHTFINGVPKYRPITPQTSPKTNVMTGMKYLSANDRYSDLAISTVKTKWILGQYINNSKIFTAKYLIRIVILRLINI